MREFGIILSDKDVHQDLTFDTRKSKVTTDMDPALKHVDVLSLDGGTIINGANQLIGEVLFKMPHGLGFRPKILSYFYVNDIPGDIPTDAEIGTYSADALWMVTTAAALSQEVVWVDADEVNMYVKHSVKGYAPTFKGNGNRVKYLLRYIITGMEDISPRQNFLAEL